MTPNHYLYNRNQQKDWSLVRADECIQTVEFKKDANNTKKDIKSHTVGSHKIDMDLWLEFLGYYLSEGSSGTHTYDSGKVSFVSIAQTKKYTRKIMWECLKQLPFKFNKQKRQFVHQKQSGLVAELLQFGHAHQKHIPQYVWDCSERQLRILYEAMMLGDGSVSEGKSGTKRTYYTSSKQLADAFQRLLLHCGYCGDISSINRIGRTNGSNNTTRHIEYRVGIKQTVTTPQPSNGGYKPILLPYEGEVFCVTTKSGVIYTRRNGKAMWGGNSFVDGPKRHGQPDGSFWADASVINRMCAQGDSFAMSSYAGYPKQNYFL